MILYLFLPVGCIKDKIVRVYELITEMPSGDISVIIQIMEDGVLKSIICHSKFNIQYSISLLKRLWEYDIYAEYI